LDITTFDMSAKLVEGDLKQS